MFKKLVIILIFFCANSIFSLNLAISAENNTPDKTAVNLIERVLLKVQKLNKQQQTTIKNTVLLIMEDILLPNMAVETSAQLSLKNHWQELNSEQKIAFQKYITQSLIADYSSLFSTYGDHTIDIIDIQVDPIIKRKENKAIVTLFIKTKKDEQQATVVSLKMIYQDKWLIYDVVFFGVSLVKNYQSQFDSHIKRKGLANLINKIQK